MEGTFVRDLQLAIAKRAVRRAIGKKPKLIHLPTNTVFYDQAVVDGFLFGPVAAWGTCFFGWLNVLLLWRVESVDRNLVPYLLVWFFLFVFEGQTGWLLMAGDRVAAGVLSILDEIVEGQAQARRRQSEEHTVDDHLSHLRAGCDRLIAGQRLVHYWRTEAAHVLSEGEAETIERLAVLVQVQQQAEASGHKIELKHGEPPYNGGGIMRKDEFDGRQGSDGQAYDGTGCVDAGDLTRIAGVGSDGFSSHAASTLRESHPERGWSQPQAHGFAQTNMNGIDSNAAEPSRNSVAEFMKEDAQVAGKEKNKENGNLLQQIRPSVLWRVFPFMRLAILLSVGMAAAALIFLRV